MLYYLFQIGAYTQKRVIELTGMINKKRVNPFVQIDKNMLGDNNISWKAKGILSYLLSKPDGWITYLVDIEKQSTDGRDSVSAGIKELEKTGYIKRKRIREKGKFKGWEYHVYEYPQQKVAENGFSEIGNSENGETENGKTENGKTEYGKPATSNNDLSNNDLSNNDFNNNNDNAHVENEPIETPFQFYEKNGFGILTPYIGQKVGAWIDDTNNELVIHAMKIAIENSVPRWSYVETILKDWQQKKLTSVSNVLAAEEQRRQQNEALKKRPRYGSPGKEETIPEWMKEDKRQKRPFTSASDEFDIAEERRKLQEELGHDA